MLLEAFEPVPALTGAPAIVQGQALQLLRGNDAAGQCLHAWTGFVPRVNDMVFEVGTPIALGLALPASPKNHATNDQLCVFPVDPGRVFADADVFPEEAAPCQFRDAERIHPTVLGGEAKHLLCNGKEVNLAVEFMNDGLKRRSLPPEKPLEHEYLRRNQPQGEQQNVDLTIKGVCRRFPSGWWILPAMVAGLLIWTWIIAVLVEMFLSAGIQP